MTKEAKKYTDSALNDAFVNFFKTFKRGTEYKYISMIDAALQAPHKIMIDCADFTEELQTIMDSEPQARLHAAIYRAIIETFQVRFASDSDKFKKDDLFQYEILNHAEFAGKTFRRPAAPTESVLIEAINKVVKDLPEERINFDTVYNQTISLTNIGYMADFQRGNPNYQEIETIIHWCILEDGRKSRNVQLGVDLMTDKYDFAHIEDLTYAEQYNCHVYRGNRWDRNVPSFTMKELTKYRGMPDFYINKASAAETEAKISNHENTVIISINDEYRKLRANMIIDGFGHYFDLHEGVIRDIHPRLHFFESVDVKYELIDGTREPESFIEFLKVRYGKNWEIVRDHFAGTFLHINELGSRAKALTLVGPTNTWKSTLIDKFIDLFNEDAISAATITQLIRDTFGKSMIANRIVNHSQEESSKSMKYGHEVLKDAITASSDKVRAMYSAKMIPVYRYPRWILATNKLPTIGKDDEDASIFNRFLYIASLPISKQDKQWRDCFNTTREKQEIMMYLLKRAYEICREPGTMKTQNLEETKQIYVELTTGSLTTYLGLTEESKANSVFRKTDSSILGVGYLETLKGYCEFTGSTVSKSKFSTMLEDLNLEKSRERCSMTNDDTHTYEVNNSGPQRTLIMGLERIDVKKSPINKRVDDGKMTTLD